VSTSIGPDLPGMRCLQFLGSGGFAQVYLYERDQPRIRVAVKVMREGSLSDAQRRQFEAEADTMALLAEHPFIVPVLGAGTSAEGRPYLVMKYYPSSDLAARVADNPMSVPEALRYGIQLASAVETAHRSGIIHRDIKPSNILLSSYGVMGLSDFGIAGRPTEMGHESEVGISLPWSPREVITGESNGSVASDVYSLAATVWHLLVGHAPFYLPGGDNSERATFTRIVHDRPPTTARTDVPPSLNRLLQQAMAKAPAHRPQTALELAQHFQRVEQELRLARTEIVVLDQPGGDTLETRETLSEASAGELTRDPIAATIRPDTHPGAYEDEPATQRKPPTRVIAQPPPTAPDSSEQPTDLRPRVVSPDRTSPATPPPSGPGRRWPVAAAGGAVVVVAAVVIGIVVAHGHGSSGTTSPPHQAPPDSSIAGLGGEARPAPATPVDIKKSPEGDTVVFSWPKVPGATAYQWQYIDGLPGGRVTKPTVSVPLKEQGVCIEVAAVGHGQLSGWSKNACAS
jgi:eukaryotic-like serine/threonine-protein kinase